MLSEGVRGEDERLAETESAEVSADHVEIADDERDQTGGIEMPFHDTRHILGRHALDPRDELLEVIVGQVVQGQLEGAAPDLLAGLEAPRVAAREGGDAELELGRRHRPRSADTGDLAKRFLNRL